MKNLRNNTILDDQQKVFLESFQSSPLKDKFYLTGGTALAAFYLEHRLSEDLDFFSEEQVEIEAVLDFLHRIPAVAKIDYESKFDRKLFMLHSKTKPVLKVEFTKYPFPRLKPGAKIEGLAIDSLDDILTNKLIALTDRKDPKDYFDIYCILKAHPKMHLSRAVKDAKKKFGISGLKYVLQSKFLEKPDFSAIRSIEPLDPAEMLRFFKNSVKGL